MKVCFAVPTYLEPERPINSGVATATHTLARGLQEAGHQVRVVALSRAVQGAAVLEGVPIHYVTPDQLHWYAFKTPLIGKHLAQPLRELMNSFRLGRAVLRLHRREHFDVVEATETGSLVLAFQRVVPLLIRLHGEEYTFAIHTPHSPPSFALRLTRTLQRVALRRAKRLVAPCAAHAQTIAEELRCSVETISVVPHGLPMPIATQTRLPQLPLVLFVGRLSAIKGAYDALSAFAKARQAIPHAQLVLIGDPHPTAPQAAIEAWIAQLGISESVQQLGSLSRQALSGWYAQARLLLMPSYYESFGLVALEAMAHGLPVIGYASGGLPELIGQGGMLAPRSDTDALAEALVRALSDDQVWRTLSARALERAASYPVSAQVEQSLAIYGRIAA